jgi:hypothetical protein
MTRSAAHGARQSRPSEPRAAVGQPRRGGGACGRRARGSTWTHSSSWGRSPSGPRPTLGRWAIDSSTGWALRRTRRTPRAVLLRPCAERGLSPLASSAAHDPRPSRATSPPRICAPGGRSGAQPRRAPLPPRICAPGGRSDERRPAQPELCAPGVPKPGLRSPSFVGMRTGWTILPTAGPARDRRIVHRTRSSTGYSSRAWTFGGIDVRWDERSDRAWFAVAASAWPRARDRLDLSACRSVRL